MECGTPMTLAAAIISTLFLLIIVVLLATLYKKTRKMKSVENSLNVERKKTKILMVENERLIDYFLDFAKVISKK